MPIGLDTIYAQLGHADLFIAIGTSGNVYPAAGFVEEANYAGADSIEIISMPVKYRATLRKYSAAKPLNWFPNWSKIYWPELS